MKLLQVSVFALIATTFVASRVRASDKVVFCYYASWAHYRSGNGKFDVAQMEDAATLCTHIAYAYFGLDASGSVTILGSLLEIEAGNIASVVALKQRNPNLKVLASVGGPNIDSKLFSYMAASASHRAQFATSVLNLLLQYGFDGMDLSWEYPAQRGGTAADSVNYISLLQVLHDSLGRNNKLVTVAVSPSGEPSSYNIPAISRIVDYINVMSYDFATAWEHTVGFNSPLSGPELGQDTVTGAINRWLARGADSKKIVLGIPFYGRTFNTAGVITPLLPVLVNLGSGVVGPYTNEAGFLGYNEFCEKMSTYTLKWSDVYQAPYAYKRNQLLTYDWISYDNAASIKAKMEFVNEKGLAGAMVWTIDTDDFRGLCGNGKYPLLTTIKDNI